MFPLLNKEDIKYFEDLHYKDPNDMTWTLFCSYRCFKIDNLIPQET